MHMHDFTVYVKEGLPFTRLSLETLTLINMDWLTYSGGAGELCYNFSITYQ